MLSQVCPYFRREQAQHLQPCLSTFPPGGWGDLRASHKGGRAWAGRRESSTEVLEESQTEPPHGTVATSLTTPGPAGWGADPPAALRATCWLPVTQSGSPGLPRGLTLALSPHLAHPAPGSEAPHTALPGPRSQPCAVWCLCLSPPGTP